MIFSSLISHTTVKKSQVTLFSILSGSHRLSKRLPHTDSPTVHTKHTCQQSLKKKLPNHLKNLHLQAPAPAIQLPAPSPSPTWQPCICRAMISPLAAASAPLPSNLPLSPLHATVHDVHDVHDLHDLHALHALLALHAIHAVHVIHAVHAVQAVHAEHDPMLYMLYMLFMLYTHTCTIYSLFTIVHYSSKFP